MSPIERIIPTYFNAWNALTLDETARFLEHSCAADIAYVDPRFTCKGRRELAERIHLSRTTYPDSRVDVASALDGYGSTHRYAWLLNVPSADLRLPGLDVVTCGADGRIAVLTSFFGALVETEIGAPLRVQRFGM